MLALDHWESLGGGRCRDPLHACAEREGDIAPHLGRYGNRRPESADPSSGAAGRARDFNNILNVGWSGGIIGEREARTVATTRASEDANCQAQTAFSCAHLLLIRGQAINDSDLYATVELVAHGAIRQCLHKARFIPVV